MCLGKTKNSADATDVAFPDIILLSARVSREEIPITVVLPVGVLSLRTAKPKEEEKPKTPERKPFIFLDVGVLREYLSVELSVPGQPFPFDLERAIDDWVFLIFFVGNDFLPHLPSLEIREGAIDTLLTIWKDGLPTMGGYLTNHGTVELERAQVILDGLTAREDEIFRKRKEGEASSC
jgi:5'-3' exoribonuclease 2